MTYSESLAFLGSARRFGMKLGLETMSALAEAFGRPQDHLRFIHIAGTNGKGSTAAFCEAILRSGGSNVGLFTSPHLVSIRERVQINRESISERDFCLGLEWVKQAAPEEATFFELMTGLALWYFAREKVDFVVWETGLGGRLDATNIVHPEVCLITTIGLDHQRYLGNTLKEIAGEKAGIIKPGVPVFSTVSSGEAEEIIRKKARELGAPLTLIQDSIEDLGLKNGKQWAKFLGHEYALGLIGRHQVDNAACAVAALSYLGASPQAIQEGLASTAWPGRFEILSRDPLLVLDGAHNVEGMRTLVETWRAFLQAVGGDERARIVFASVSDKDISGMAAVLRPLAQEVFLVRLENERSSSLEELEAAFSGIPTKLYDSVSILWKDLADCKKGPPTLMTGSLFLVGEILAARQGQGTEYRLNEKLEPQVISSR